MISVFFYILATLLLSLNSFRYFGLPVSDWLYLFALLSGFIKTANSKIDLAVWIPNRVFFWAAMLISLGALVSLVNSKNTTVALLELFQQIYVITAFISLTFLMVKKDQTELVITVFVFSGVFAGLIAVVDYFWGTNYGPMLSGNPLFFYRGRYAGPLGHPNKLGYFLVLSSILTMYKFRAAWNNGKNLGSIIILLFFLIVQCIGIYASGSVTAYIGMLFGLVCVLFVNSSLRIRKLLLFLLYIIVIAILLINIIWVNAIYNPQWQISERSLIGIGMNRVLNITSGERIYLYKLSIDYISQSPIIGIGFDQNASSGISQEARILTGSVHNILLQIWYIGGIFAFLGWLIVHFQIAKIAVINVFQHSAKMTILGNYLSAAVLSSVIMDQFQNGIYQREKWLVIGMLVSWSWVNQNYKRGKKSLVPLGNTLI